MTAGVGLEARADATRVCLDLDLGQHTQDASIREEPGEGPPSDGDYEEDYGRISNPGLPNPDPPVYIDYPFPAQRWLARVTNETTGMPLFGFAPLDADGCTGAGFDLEYDENDTFKVEFVRWAEFGNRRIVAYDCDDKQEICEFGLPGEDALTAAGTPIVQGIAPVDLADTHVTVTAYLTPPAEIVSYDILSPADHVLWATSFAEETVAVRPNETFSVYAAHAYNQLSVTDVLGSTSRAGLQFGNQPSVALVHGNYRSKFICAHEYGHVQTGVLAAIPTTASDYGYRGTGGDPDGHSMNSAEWQSAAAVEGFANFYSTWVFNDVSETSAIAETGDRVTFYVPHTTEVCVNQFPCGAGVANEYDWTSALHELANQSSLGPQDVCLMLEAAYSDGSTWEATGMASAAFWNDFQSRMDSHLSMADDATWTSLAATWNIDQ